jgi:hypothetical protein
VFTGLFLGELSVSGDVVAQVSAGEEIHYEIERFAVLEGEDHVYEEGMLELREEFAFVHYGFHAVFCNDSGG